MTEKLIPASAVEDKIKSIRAKRLDIENDIDGLQHARYELIQLEEWYESILEMAVEPVPGGPTAPKPAPKLAPSDAVIALVGDEPGIDRADAIDRLEDRIDSDSDDKRHLLRNTIYGLAKRNKLIRTKDDKLFLPKQGPEMRNGSSGPES